MILPIGTTWRRAALKWCLRLVLVGVVLMLCAALVMVLRAASHASRQLPVTAAPPPAVDDGMIERLAGALRFRTVSASGEFDLKTFQALHKHLETAYPRVHVALQRETIGGGSLLFRWPGRDPDAAPILLMSHLDVVAVPRAEQPRWTHDPWAGVIADGHVWGRGALDVKCGVLSQLEAVERLLKQGFQPTRDVYLAFGHDEETGGLDGNQQIALMLRQRGVRFKFVLDEGGAIVRGALPGLNAPLALVAVAEKGIANVRLSVEVEPGHSSMPPPQTAVGILAAAITRLEQQQRPASLSGPVGLMFDAVIPEMAPRERVVLANRDLLAPLLVRKFSEVPSINALMRTTTAATVIVGGQQDNVLPGQARATVNFRLLPEESPDLILEHVRLVVNDPRVVVTLAAGAVPPSRVSDHQSAEFMQLHRVIRQVFPGTVVAPGLAVVATDARHYEPLAENVYRFLPLQLHVEDLRRIHGIDERISVENYARMVQFMELLIQETCQ